MQSENTASNNQSNNWINVASQYLVVDSNPSESRLRTNLACKKIGRDFALFVPPDMAELEPQSLRYLQLFARRNNFKLVEDRRTVETKPAIELRRQPPPRTALGLALLLKQTGMPGVARSLSEPHRLNNDSPYIPIDKLIKMASFAQHSSKRVSVESNRLLDDVLGRSTTRISGQACKIKTSQATTILSCFDSDGLKAIGYSAGTQYVMHLCLAGGPITESTLWAKQHTLTTNAFRFELFPNVKPLHTYGLLYGTFYLDVSNEPTPWWINESQANAMASGKTGIFN